MHNGLVVGFFDTTRIQGGPASGPVWSSVWSFQRTTRLLVTIGTRKISGHYRYETSPMPTCLRFILSATDVCYAIRWMVLHLPPRLDACLNLNTTVCIGRDIGRFGPEVWVGREIPMVLPGTPVLSPTSEPTEAINQTHATNKWIVCVPHSLDIVTREL